MIKVLFLVAVSMLFSGCIAVYDPYYPGPPVYYYHQHRGPYNRSPVHVTPAPEVRYLVPR
jgi:hypothetical protein